ncbi:glycosyltransferase [Thermodesulfobacteriota bacterium]
MSPNECPKISIISFCLNSGQFLRDTVESVLNQSYTNFEHIIIDGGSTDDTIKILKDYPHLRWISEKEEGDNTILDAIWKGVNMARGEYLGLLAISDGIYDKDWFKRSVEVLDTDNQLSAVWGLSQVISEEGHLGKVFFPEYLESHPPQKMDFLSLWLSNGHGLECNAVYRRNVFDICFPKNHPDEPYRFHPTLGFNYQLNTRGYLPYFIPIISFCGRTHKSQIQEVLYDLVDSTTKKYDNDVKLYRKKFLSGKVSHCFRDGSSEIIKEITLDELSYYKKQVWRYRIKGKINRNVKKLLEHI